MKLFVAIFLSMFFASCSSWTGQPTISKATIVKGTLLDSVRRLFSKDESAFHPSINILKKADTSKYDLTSFVDTNNNILQIELPLKNRGTIKTNIAVSNSVGHYIYNGKVGDSALCKQSKDFWFMAWFDEPFYENSVAGPFNKSHRYKLHIRIIEKNGHQVFDDVLYSSTCCLDRLDIQYNPLTRSLLYAFNDFGGKGYEIIYGFINIDQNGKGQFRIPHQIPFKDKFEKRQPIFIRNESGIFLYHTTGDSWELLSGHVGKQGIGIFKINSANQVSEHRVINDESGLDDKILMVRDTIFYRLLDNHDYNKMTIKKIAWKDLDQQWLK
jgi:hypothetical protein